MSVISTHILDAVLGKPATGVTVHLEHKVGDAWTVLVNGITDTDGRCRDLCPESKTGTYRLTFATKAYFEKHGRESIYPEITITFTVDGVQKYHIPLLLSDNSYTTYRGS